MSNCGCQSCIVNTSCMKKQFCVVCGVLLSLLGIVCISLTAGQFQYNGKVVVIIGLIVLIGGILLFLCGCYHIYVDNVLKKDVTKSRRRQRKREIMRNVYHGPSSVSDQTSLVPNPIQSPSEISRVYIDPQTGETVDGHTHQTQRTFSDSECCGYPSGAPSTGTVIIGGTHGTGRRCSTAGGRFQIGHDYQSYSTVMTTPMPFPVMSHSTLPSMPSSEFPSVFSLPSPQRGGDRRESEFSSRRVMNKHRTLSAPHLASNPRRKQQSEIYPAGSNIGMIAEWNSQSG